MSHERAIELFATDCDVSVFHAEIGGARDPRDENRRAVHVYPRKGGPGFVWIVRGPMNLDDIDACVIDGDVIAPACGLEAAVLVAIAELLRYAATDSAP